MELLAGRLTVADPDELIEALDAVGAEYDCAVQAFDASMVVGRGHLETAVEHANRSVARGEAVARDRAVEILLYAAGRRQIERALELGVDAGTAPAVLVLDADARVEPADGTALDDAGVEAAASAEAAALDALRERLEIAVTDEMAPADEAAVEEYFEIGDAELAATSAGLDALVGERVALLDVEK